MLSHQIVQTPFVKVFTDSHPHPGELQTHQHTSTVEHVSTHSRKCAKFKALFTPPYRWDTQNELLMTHILLYAFFYYM